MILIYLLWRNTQDILCHANEMRGHNELFSSAPFQTGRQEKRYGRKLENRGYFGKAEKQESKKP